MIEDQLDDAHESIDALTDWLLIALGTLILVGVMGILILMGYAP